MGGVTLAVAGQVWRGWQQVSCRRALDDFAGSWDLQVTERWPGQPDKREIKAGLPCALGLDGAIALSGYIDAVSIDEGRDSHTVRVSGRGPGGDLVDCDVLPPWDYRNLDLTALATKLAAPFGLTVRAETDVGAPFERFAIQPGETVFTAIERACRLRAVLPSTDTRDGIVLTRAGAGGAAPVALSRGGDDGTIKSASRRTSWAERFSEVHARGQQEHHDEIDTEQAAGPAAVVRDGEISRYRPKLLVAEGQGNGGTLQERAAWQVAVAKGKADEATVTVQGWRAGTNGPLWQPNWTIAVTDPLLGLMGATRLIAGVTMTVDRQGGSLTTLRLVPPEAFLLESGGGQE